MHPGPDLPSHARKAQISCLTDNMSKALNGDSEPGFSETSADATEVTQNPAKVEPAESAKDQHAASPDLSLSIVVD